MKQIKIVSLAWLGMVSLAACSVEESVPATGENRAEIVLAVGSPTETTATRAVLDAFPNSGSIGVLASVYDENNTDEDGNVVIYWKSYAEILNAPAVAKAPKEGETTYSFYWEGMPKGKKYWPFDGGKLVFMAYSPHVSHAPLNLAIDVDSLKHLAIALSPVNQDTPDVMWASNNGNHTPYSKDPVTPSADTLVSPAVQLGEFRHVLSQLTVEVVAAGAMVPQIVINNLHVSTTKTSGVLALGNGELTVPEGESANPHVYTLFTGNVPFKNETRRKTVLLFPGTEDVTRISITLVNTDTPDIPYTREFMMPFFPNIDSNSGETMKLEAGMNTTLRLVVHSIGVPDPGEDIELKGTISGWNEQGKFGVTIN